MDKKEVIQTLIYKAKTGDNDSIEKIIEVLKGPIGYIARKFAIKGYDQDDLVSEGFKEILNAIKKYDSSKNDYFYYYGLKAVDLRYRYLYRSYMKKQRDEEVVSLTEKVSEILESKGPSVEERVYLKVIREAITKLPKEESDIINAVYIKDTPLAEIARNKGLTFSRVQYLRNKGLEKLRVMV